MKVTLSAGARRDLLSIGEWISRDNRPTADRVVGDLLDACEEIGAQPELYALVQGSRTLRKRLRRPHLIFYRVRRGEVLIVSVRHGARDNQRFL